MPFSSKNERYRATIRFNPLCLDNGTMTKERNALAALFASCWRDDALKARFMSDPKAVLKEHGMDVPEGIDVKVVENADDCVHIPLPAAPAGDIDLSDGELGKVAGGHGCKCHECDAIHSQATMAFTMQA